MNQPIVIVGGGFAGFWAAVAARRVAGDAEVVLISRDPVLQMRPRLYEAHPETLGVDLSGALDRLGVRFVRGEARELAVADRRLELSTGETTTYGRLVVATGSCLRRPPVIGAEHAYTIDNLADAIAFDRRLETIVEAVAKPVIAIIGAGFTGVELALELRDRIAARGGSALADASRIVLVDRAPTVGSELGPGPRPQIESALAAARIECTLDATVIELGADRVRFADGRHLDAHAVVLTTGMAAAPFVDRVPGTRDALGRIVVDRSLRAPSAPDVFVAGDAAAADTGDGHHSLQSCQHALQLGRFAGENAARDLLGMPTIPYTQTRYVTCLDLGRSGAVFTVGRERTVAKVGDDAKALKRQINTTIIYPPIDASREELIASSTTDLGAQPGR